MNMKCTCRAAALMVVLASTPLAAAEPTTVVASTGLHSLLPAHVAVVTVSSVAAAGDGSVKVQLLLLDGRDRVLREVRGTVRRGQPLSLRALRSALPAGPSAHLPVRAVARVELAGDPAADLPTVLTFETWNPTASDNLVALMCRLPASKPDTGGGNPVGDCGGGGKCHIEFDDGGRP